MTKTFVVAAVLHLPQKVYHKRGALSHRPDVSVPKGGKTNLSLLAISLVLAGALILVLVDPESVVKPVTETSTVTLQPPVMPSVYEWVYDLQSRDSNSLAGMYAPGANITWTGDITGLSPAVGTYEGRGNIEILYGSWLGNDSALSANITNYSQEKIAPSVENATFTLTMVGDSPVLGGFRMAANVTQSWNYAGGQWQVLEENWNFTTYNIQFPG